MLPSRSQGYAKPVQGECSGKAGKRSFTRLDIAEPQPGLCKAGASESNESLLLNCRVQPGLCKGTKKKPYPATFIPMNGHINRINFIILTARFHMSVTPFNDNHTSQL